MGNIMRRLCLGDAADAVEMSAIESVPTIAGKPAENKKGIMMVDITVKNILEATGGVLLCGDENTVLTDICINSKEAKEGDLFVPIIGSRTDGHRFIESALQVAAATLTSEHDNVVVSDKAYIRVDDTVKALQAIGKYIRNRYDMPVVAVTGSVGKTTTREMITAAVSAGRKKRGLGKRNEAVNLSVPKGRLMSGQSRGRLRQAVFRSQASQMGSSIQVMAGMSRLWKCCLSIFCSGVRWNSGILSIPLWAT